MSGVHSNLSGRLLGFFFLLVLASRLPLLGGGFGSDDDAWRNAVGALHMREVGHYVASRPPGFPVFEGLLVPLVPMGWVATNLLTALAGALAAVCFLAIARRLEIRGAAWLTSAFAFGGVLWVHTTQTMDYAVGLAFLLAGYWALLDRRHLAGGLLLALAAGCRLSTGLLALPAVVMLLARRENWRGVATFCVSFAVGVAVVYSPVVAAFDPQSYAGRALRHASRGTALDHLFTVVRKGAVFLFGKLGVLALVAGLLWSGVAAMRRRNASRGSAVRDATDPARRAAVLFEVGAVLIVGVLFLAIPYESAYLIPMLPFALLLAGRVLDRRWLVAFTILMVSESLVVPLVEQRRIIPGMIFQEITQRRGDLESTRDLALRRPSEPTVFVVGRFATQRLLVLEPSLERTEAAWAPFYESGVALWSPDRQSGFAAYLDDEDREALELQGYHILDHGDAAR